MQPFRTPTVPLDAPEIDPFAVQATSHHISTLRAVRRFQRTPVHAELIDFVLHHATQAASGKNRQPWRFVVIRNEDTRAAVSAWYRSTWRLHADHSQLLNGHEEKDSRQTAASRLLADHLDEAPVLIVVCFVPSATNPPGFFGGASIYPAIQNLMLAARSVGLGTTLTTVQAVDELSHDTASGACHRLRAVLGIPGHIVPAAMLPLGYPLRSFTTTRNRWPVSAVTFADHWGNEWTSDSR
jgi:nitroreductase